MAVLIQATELYARVGMLQFDDVWRAVAETRGPEALDAGIFDELRSLTLRARERHWRRKETLTGSARIMYTIPSALPGISTKLPAKHTMSSNAVRSQGFGKNCVRLFS
jgi:hypothetical protein